MKILIYLSIILIMSFTSKLYSQYTCGTNECSSYSCPGCTQWSDWAKQTITISYPGFESCPIDVEYCYRECLDGPPDVKMLCWDIYVLDWQPSIEAWTCGDCAAFWSWLNGGDPDQQAATYAQFEYYLWEQLNIARFDNFLNNTPSDAWPYCNQGVFIKAHSSQENCRAWCYVQNPISNPSIPMQITTVKCSSSFCCTKELSFCIDEYGDVVMAEQDVMNPPINCYGTTPLQDCPPGQNVGITPCTNTCIH